MFKIIKTTKSCVKVNKEINEAINVLTWPRSSLTVSRHVVSWELLEVSSFKPLMVSEHRPHGAGPRLFEHLLDGRGRREGQTQTRSDPDRFNQRSEC